MTQEIEVQFRARSDEMRQKYIYFILTATGACIGFAVTQSRDIYFALTVIPLGLALVAWALSFFCGCRSLYWKPAALMQNIETIKIQAGVSEFAGSHLEQQRIAYGVFLKGYENAIRKFSTYMRLQFALFIAGSALFLLWHVLEMWARTHTIPT